MDKRTEFEDEEDYRNYLLETGSLYLGEFEGEEMYFVDIDKCGEYAPWLLDSAESQVEEALAVLIESGQLNVEYNPEINENGEVEFNPTFKVNDE